MIEDAREYFKNMGNFIEDKIIIDGFSASSKFANRFTILHPNIVALCISGGVSGALTLPLDWTHDTKLLWPIGIGNLSELLSLKIQGLSKMPN